MRKQTALSTHDYVKYMVRAGVVVPTRSSAQSNAGRNVRQFDFPFWKKPAENRRSDVLAKLYAGKNLLPLDYRSKEDRKKAATAIVVAPKKGYAPAPIPASETAAVLHAPQPAVGVSVLGQVNATAPQSKFHVTRGQSKAAASATSGDAVAAATASVVASKKGSAPAPKSASGTAAGLHAPQPAVGVSVLGQVTATAPQSKYRVTRGQNKAAAAATSVRVAAPTAVFVRARGGLHSNIKKVSDRNRVNRAKICVHGKRKTRCPRCIKKMKTGTGSLCKHLKQKGWCLECQKDGKDYYGEGRK